MKFQVVACKFHTSLLILFIFEVFVTKNTQNVKSTGLFTDIFPVSTPYSELSRVGFGAYRRDVYFNVMRHDCYSSFAYCLL